jgi:hypothetical protein
VPARGWWATKLRRTGRYLRARVPETERATVAKRLTTTQLALFDGMHAADRRHGLDVMAHLEARGVTDADLLLAGLLHDCGKGPRVRFTHRVAWSLGQHYGAWIWRAAAHLPTFRTGLAAMRDHAERSARLAGEAGCSIRAVDLIRNQENPTDDAGRLLLEADEAN